MDKKYNGSSVIYGKKSLWFCNILSCYLVLWSGSYSKLSCFKWPWSCLFLKNLCPLNVKECAEGLQSSWWVESAFSNIWNEKFLTLGNFNIGIEDQHMTSFYKNYNFGNLIKQPTCYKNWDSPTCIDLILSNIPRSFQSTCIIEAGLSDFYFMTLTVIKKIKDWLHCYFR